jgi:hypothetical protein
MYPLKGRGFALGWGIKPIKYLKRKNPLRRVGFNIN